MKRLLLALLVAGSQALFAGVPEFYNLPRAGNVYFDNQGCRYVGVVKLRAGVNLYRLCPGIETVKIGWVPLPDSFLSKVEDGSRLHFFDDEDYPIWIQPESGQPYSLINTSGTYSYEFARLVSSLGHGDSHRFAELLWRWFDNHSDWARTIEKSAQYNLIAALVLLPITIKPEMYSTWQVVYSGNRYNALKGKDHVAGVWNALEIMGGAWKEWLTEDNLFSIGSNALKEELMFRFGVQWGTSTGLAYLLPEADDWPARQRFISRTSKLMSSALFAAGHLYYTPSRSEWLFFRYLISSYLVEGEIYERFGLAGSFISHSLFNIVVPGWIAVINDLFLHIGMLQE